MYNEKYSKIKSALTHKKTKEGQRNLRIAEKVSAADFPYFKIWDEVTEHLLHIFYNTFKGELQEEMYSDKLLDWLVNHVRKFEPWSCIAHDYWDTVKGVVVSRYLK